MIPALALLRVVSPGLRLRLWLPLFLAWPFVAVIALLVLPLALVAWVFDRAEVLAGMRCAWNVMTAFTGTSVEINGRDSVFLLHIV